MATGARGPAGQIVREPVTVERVFVIDFVTALLHSTGEKFVKEKDFKKSLATRNPVPVSMATGNIWLEIMGVRRCGPG